MPRWPEKSLNAAEQDVGKDSDLLLPATGSIVRNEEGIVTSEQPIEASYADELRFMEEPVEVLVHDSTDPNAENPVALACNGVNQFVFRNQPIVIKRKYVEILARSKTTAISTHEAKDFNGDNTMRIRKTTALRYPFSVIQDPNPKGAAWLRAILAQG